MLDTSRELTQSLGMHRIYLKEVCTTDTAEQKQSVKESQAVNVIHYFEELLFLEEHLIVGFANFKRHT